MLYDEAVDPKTGDLMFNADAGAYSDYINDGGIVAGKDQVRQNIEDRLRMVYGEWFLNTEIGVPWFDKVLVKNPDLSAIDIILKSTILDTIEVTELLAYKSALDRTRRKFSVTFTALSIYGNIVFNNLEI
ncbi:MAG TPA: hypothetical protein VKF42_11020 [Chitinivibrionales bacterium]|nr:hypothetical protein [Chitinivibrionales bacterium]